MKTREGFVSNSSTSSFLCVGFKLDKKPKNISEKESGNFVVDSYDREDYFYMVEFARAYESTKTFSLEEFDKRYNEAKAKAQVMHEKLGSKENIKVIAGVIDMGGEGGFIPIRDLEEDEDDDEPEADRSLDDHWDQDGERGENEV